MTVTSRTGDRCASGDPVNETAPVGHKPSIQFWTASIICSPAKSDPKKRHGSTRRSRKSLSHQQALPAWLCAGHYWRYSRILPSTGRAAHRCRGRTPNRRAAPPLTGERSGCVAAVNVVLLPPDGVVAPASPRPPPRSRPNWRWCGTAAVVPGSSCTRKQSISAIADPPLSGFDVAHAARAVARWRRGGYRRRRRRVGITEHRRIFGRRVARVGNDIGNREGGIVDGLRQLGRRPRLERACPHVVVEWHVERIEPHDWRGAVDGHARARSRPG